MNFNQIPANAWVFIDSNILVYHFTPHPKFGAECQLLMQRIYKWQDFHAYTSTQVLSELAHQLMIHGSIEAIQLAFEGHYRPLA
jgi:predicted nucleic acid-binding protein